MLMPQINYLQCSNQAEKYKMYYTTWGNQEECRKTLLCVHGLNRNSRDWDFIGNHFALQGYYVIAPDLVGRGNSDYLTDYKGYDIACYIADIFRLIQTLHLVNIHYLGTSLGGIIGMYIAAMENNPLQKLVLNDIGAEIEQAGIKRIASYTSEQPQFDTYLAARNYIFNLSKDFGDLPYNVWEAIARHSLQKNLNGKYELKRDVNLSKPFAGKFASQENVKLWDCWHKVNLSTLVIRGAKSDILSLQTITKMQQTNPKMQSAEIINAGHAPFLYHKDHFDLLTNFFS